MSIPKFKFKRGDVVEVIAGEHKGSKGKVLQIQSQKERALVEGVNLVKKHTKPNQQNEEGGIFDREAPIHVSNLRKVSSEASQDKE